MLSFLNGQRDLGLLLLRLGLGGMFFWVHGVPKLMAGPERWAKLGAATEHLGVAFAPTALGLMAGMTEAFGGLLLALGLFTRQSSFFLLVMMTVASVNHLASGDGLKGASHAIEAGIVFLGLVFAGPGRFSLDARRGAAG